MRPLVSVDGRCKRTGAGHASKWKKRDWFYFLWVDRRRTAQRNFRESRSFCPCFMKGVDHSRRKIKRFYPSSALLPKKWIPFDDLQSVVILISGRFFVYQVRWCDSDQFVSSCKRCTYIFIENRKKRFSNQVPRRPGSRYRISPALLEKGTAYLSDSLWSTREQVRIAYRASGPS